MEPPLVLQAVILGAIQGVCEFLPISSSAHLVVIPKLLGWSYLGKGFDVALHFGTLFALLSYFRGDLAELTRAFQRLVFSGGRARDEKCRLVNYLILASIPAALSGYVLEPWVEKHLQSLGLVAFMMIVGGLLLFRVDGACAGVAGAGKAVNQRIAWLAGCAQAVALLPGISRSGATITALLCLGLSRKEAARFSYLMSIPVVAGASLFKAISGISQGLAGPLLPILSGMLMSAAVGYFCLGTFLAYIKRGSYRYCAYYRVVGGCLILFWLFLNRL